MKIVKHTGVVHLWPYCCAEDVGISKYKTGNWLWLFWMFCLEYNTALEPTK